MLRRFEQESSPAIATVTHGICPKDSNNQTEKSVLQTILGNHLLLSIIILLALFLVPTLLLRGRGLRNPHGDDRRKGERYGVDRRA